MKLTVAKFAGAISVSRNAIYKALDAQKLVKGDDKKIDTEDEVNKIYIEMDPAKAAAFKNYSSGGVTEKKPKKTKATVAPSVKNDIAADNSENNSIGSANVPAATGGGMSLADIAVAKSTADMQKSQNQAIKVDLENQQTINKLAPRGTIEFIISRNMNHIVTGSSIMASTVLTDIAKDILANGKIENKHFKMLEDGVKELLNEARLKTKKDIEDAEI